MLITPQQLIDWHVARSNVAALGVKLALIQQLGAH